MRDGDWRLDAGRVVERMSYLKMKAWLISVNDWVYLRQACEHFGVARGDAKHRAAVNHALRYLAERGDAETRIVGLTQYRIKT